MRKMLANQLMSANQGMVRVAESNPFTLCYDMKGAQVMSFQFGSGNKKDFFRVFIA